MLPSSGTITSGMINEELGRDANAPLNIPLDPDVRTLTGIPSGPITAPDDFWGKSFTPLRPIAWNGPPTQTIGGSPALSARYVIRADGRVTWYWTRSDNSAEGLSGYWTSPPVFEDDGVEIRYYIVSGSNNVDSSGPFPTVWYPLNTPTSTLTLTKTSGGPSEIGIEIRRNGGPVQASWRVTLIV